MRGRDSMSSLTLIRRSLADNLDLLYEDQGKELIEAHRDHRKFWISKN